MEKDPSPLDTLRQLKEWLDAGTITPAEFETLKRKLLFSEPTASPPAAAEPIAPTPVAPPAPVPPAPVAPPAEPVAFRSSTIIEPVNEPVPPRVTPIASEIVPPVKPFAEPLPLVEPVRPTPEFIRPPDYVRPAPAPEVNDYDAEPTEPEQETFPTEPARNPLSTILIVGGIVALLALVAYLMLGNRESEHLSSISQTEADSLRTAPETGPQADQIELPAAAAPETVRVVPAVPPALSQPATDSTRTTAPAPADAAPAEAPAADDSAVRGRVEGLLSSYYEDLKAAPFSAAQYFAPSVERFYTLQNTTPAAINEELIRSHFPEFLEAETQIEPGTLKISEPVEDGSRVVTFLEKSSALRQSLQKHQQIRAQVRIRLDRNFKIKYLRQERLLENTFTD